MKRIFHIFLLMAISLISKGNIYANQNTGIDSKVITRNYEVYGFHGISLNTTSNIVITQSTDGTSSLTMQGNEELLNKIKVYVKDGVLYIKEGRRGMKYKNTKLSISITTPELTIIDTDGVGNINIKNGLNTPSLDIKNNGVGNIYINQLKCSSLNIISDGVGSININGEANNAILRLKGVGSINAENLKAQSVKATSDGVGNIKCYATEAIDASIRGVGGIGYKGNPTTKNFHRDGVGRIKNI